jgi:Protein of unknown function (DUF1501)
MLNLNPFHTRPVHRRDVLATLGALGVSIALPAMGECAAARRGAERPMSLITLWMGGGMSQLETWDPHPGSESGGQVGAIETSAPGIRISDLLPQVAEQMRSCLLIRSLSSKEGDHDRGTTFVKTGYRPEPTLKYPALGAIAAHELPDSSIEIPMHVSLAGDRQFAKGGYLGNEWDAFRVFNPGGNLSNLRAGVSDERLQFRLQGLNVVSRQFERQRKWSAVETLHQDTVDSALKMMSSEQLTAFQLEDESEAIQASYGDSRFGRGCLVARRLVETGVRAVEVTLSGFDTHVSNHEGHVTQCEMLDPALATLLADLRERDLLDSTIVLCISEFGRTPSINPADGRDHWPNWFSCLVAGGGFRAGTVIGETPAGILSGSGLSPSDPVSIPELYATVLSAMGVEFDKEVMTPIGRPMRLTDADPLSRLLTDAAAARLGL